MPESHRAVRCGGYAFDETPCRKKPVVMDDPKRPKWAPGSVAYCEAHGLHVARTVPLQNPFPCPGCGASLRPGLAYTCTPCHEAIGKPFPVIHKAERRCDLLHEKGRDAMLAELGPVPEENRL